MLYFGQVDIVCGMTFLVWRVKQNIGEDRNIVEDGEKKNNNNVTS